MDVPGDARTELAREAARLSETMLQAARADLWEEVEILRARRDAALRGAFQAPASDDPRWLEAARKTQALNDALAELAGRERDRILRELTTLQRGAAAQNAYAEYL